MIVNNFNQLINFSAILNLGQSTIKSNSIYELIKEYAKISQALRSKGKLFQSNFSEKFEHLPTVQIWLVRVLKGLFVFTFAASTRNKGNESPSQIMLA